MSFDLDALMNQTVDAPMATYVPPIPEGECLARVGAEPDDVKLESFPGKKDPTRTFYRLTLMWDIIDHAYLSLANREKARVRDAFFIDIDPTTGMLMTGPTDNVDLGARRAALGLNEGSFNLPMLRGAGPAMIAIKHRADDNDKEKKYAEVRRAVAV